MTGFALINPFWVAPQTWEARIVVPAGRVGETLTDFALPLDLADLPTEFWGAVSSDGANLRAYDAAETPLPLDVVRISPTDQTGFVVFKATLSPSVDNIFFLRAEPGLAGVPAGDPIGGTAVWSAYHRAWVFDSLIDRAAGQAVTLSGTTSNYSWQVNGISATLAGRQGVAWDGTSYWVTDDVALYKYNASFVLQASWPTFIPDQFSSGGVNHIGDPGMSADGKIYLPVEIYPGPGATPGGDPFPGSYLNTYIVVWDPGSNAVVGNYHLGPMTPRHNIVGADAGPDLGWGREVSAVAVQISSGRIFVADFTDSRSIPYYTFDGGDLEYAGKLVLWGGLYRDKRIQGIAFYAGKLYVHCEANKGELWRMNPDTGAAEELVWSAQSNSNNQGIDTGPNGLFVTVERKIYDVRPGIAGEPGWLRFQKGGFGIAPVSKYSTWSIMAMVRQTDIAGTQAIVTYTGNGETNDANRETLGFRGSANNRFGAWANSTWLDGTDALTTTLSQKYALHMTRTGTTRRFWQDGRLLNGGTGTGNQPAGAGDRLYIGQQDADTTERWGGQMRCLLMRNVVSSPGWIEAEAAAWLNPRAVYHIDPVEPFAEEAMGFVNLGAENGTTGWTVLTGALTTRNVVPAHSGSWFFDANATGPNLARQTADVAVPIGRRLAVDAGTQRARLRYWTRAQGVRDDVGRIYLEFYDAGAALVGTLNPDVHTAESTGWSKVEVVGTVPAGTRSVRMLFNSITRTGGAAQFYIDTISATWVDD